MTVYVIVQLKMTDRAAYDRYQARFFDVFKKFSGRRLSADENPAILEGTWDRDTGIDVISRRVRLSCMGKLAGISGNHERPQSRRAGRRAAGEGICTGCLTTADHYHPNPNPKANGNGAGA